MVGKVPTIRNLVLYSRKKATVSRALEEPWECVKSNGLEKYLGNSTDETW